MTVDFDPKKILKKARPRGGFRKLVTKDLKINRAILSGLDKSGFIAKNNVVDVALNAIKAYKENERKLIKEGLSKSRAKKAAINDGALIEKRVENSIIHEISKRIKDAYKGVWFEWLPSDADNPDPVHQLKYGKKFRIGIDEIPGERFGCHCGMRILTPDEVLEL